MKFSKSLGFVLARTASHKVDKLLSSSLKEQVIINTGTMNEIERQTIPEWEINHRTTRLWSFWWIRQMSLTELLDKKLHIKSVGR
jgi:hypothetical protein